MMINIHALYVALPDISRQIPIKDKHFFPCQYMMVDKKTTFFIRHNILAFTMHGQKVFHHNDHSRWLTNNEIDGISTLTYGHESYIHATGWEVPVFYCQDEYNGNLFKKIMDHDHSPPDKRGGPETQATPAMHSE